MYPTTHTDRLWRVFQRDGLDGSPGFLSATPEARRGCYNGIGSDKFRALLDMTTALFGLFEPAAFCHDWDWGPGNDGTRESWRISNDRFRANCHKLAANSSIVIHLFRPQIRAERHWWADRLADVVSSELGWSLYRKGAPLPDEGPELVA